LLLLGISGIRYYLAYRALQDGRDAVLDARQLLTADLGHLDNGRIEAARIDLQRASDDFGGKSSMLQDGWLGSVATHLPGLGPQVRTARALRTAGAAGTQLGLDIVALLENVVPRGPDPRPPFQRLVALATAHRSEVDRAAKDADGFRAAIAAVPTEAVWGPLDRSRQSVVGDGTKVVQATAPALGILRALPVAVGPGHHSYLLLLENPGEERPGGGYIGAVGVLSFSDGAISGLDFRGSEYYTSLVKDIPAPGPLDRYLFRGQHWELGDANWAPDFPASMTAVERFYTLATGKTVDGDISVDPVALSYILTVLGPMQVPPYPQVITAQNVLIELNYITNKARPQDPGKEFLPPFGKLMMDSLLQAPLAQLPPLSNALNRGAHEKHVALYFHDAQLQTLVDGAGYGGRLARPLSDSLLVDDANLSGTKGDLFVKRDMHLSVTVNADGSVKDELVLNYRNPKVSSPADRNLVPNSGGDYRDYLRVYLPETAQLSAMLVGINGAKAVPVSPDAVTYELGHAAIAYWLVVPAGGSAQVTLQYGGPFADITATPEAYGLIWQKQVNALFWPVEVTVSMADGRKAHWSETLDSDHSWAVG